MAVDASELSLKIVPYQRHDAAQFTSNLASIKKYIQEQAHRDVSSYTSSVFVLTESGNMVVYGYYSLSSLSIAQIRALKNCRDVGSALFVIDAEMPSVDDPKIGARDPLPFYSKYGFVSLTANPRRVIKTMRAIAKEFEGI